MLDLNEIIARKIKKEGPVSFHDFMEMCLYYPGLGYYTSAKDKIGKNGDYYTSSFLTPAFGAMIGRQLEEMWSRLKESTFTVVEYGAGMGLLSHDILNYLKANRKLYNQLNYCIIEKSPAMRARASAHLNEKVSWVNAICDLPDITGCILSNELVDNFAVHSVVMQDELMEVFIDYKEGFTEILKPACQALKDYLEELNVVLPEGFRTEINLEAIEWIKEIGAALKKGYVVTIDYGFNSAELYSKPRSEGTLLCYNKHHITDCLYDTIGAQDITAHVNFSALRHWGSKNGLDCCGYTNQAHFLLGLGFTDYLKKTIEKEPDNYINYKKEAFLKRTLLVDMGSKFKVLIQGKGIARQELMGLRLSDKALQQENLSSVPFNS